MATDEQIERVRDYMLHGCLNDEYSEALAAVLDELTALRNLADAMSNPRSTISEVDTALAAARK